MIVSIVPETAEVDISTPNRKLELAQLGERTINRQVISPIRRAGSMDLTLAAN
jgi:hypothetical protein